jgi:hypothetical protein
VGEAGTEEHWFFWRRLGPSPRTSCERRSGPVPSPCETATARPGPQPMGSGPLEPGESKSHLLSSDRLPLWLLLPCPCYSDRYPQKKKCYSDRLLT